MAIALCADDYAQHQGVDDAVCTLLASARLSAVSCMSDAPRWQAQAAPRLRELDSADAGFDIGLHLNLTESYGAGPISLARLIARCYAGRLDKHALHATLTRQFDAFEQAMGRAPDFIDGHQHVHQLPQVRGVVLDLLAQRYPGAPIWVRNTLPAPGLRGVKTGVLTLLGGATLAHTLKARGVPSNVGFGGVYGFDTPDYAGQFARWLGHAQAGMLLMCHPGSAPDAHDPISAQRLVEYDFFRSAQFPAMMEAAGVRLAALSTLLPERASRVQDVRR